MMYGNRAFLIVALFGLAAFSGILGYTLAASTNPERDQNRTYQYSTNVADLRRVPGGNETVLRRHRPCENQKGREESELCAQWVAATAAADNVLWTERQFWVGIATAIGLALTVILTLRAVWTAEASLRHAQDISKTELRAYLVVTKPEVTSVADSKFRASRILSNAGSTPAYDVVCSLNIGYLSYPISEELPNANLIEPVRYSFVAPRDQREVWTGFTLNEEQIVTISASEACLILVASIEYKLFDGTHVVEPQIISIVVGEGLVKGEVHTLMRKHYAPEPGGAAT